MNWQPIRSLASQQIALLVKVYHFSQNEIASDISTRCRPSSLDLGSRVMSLVGEPAYSEVPNPSEPVGILFI